MHALWQLAGSSSSQSLSVLLGPVTHSLTLERSTLHVPFDPTASSGPTTSPTGHTFGLERPFVSFRKPHRQTTFSLSLARCREPLWSTSIMARQINNLSPRGRIAAIAAAFITLVFLLHLVFPGSDSLLSSTQRWTTASSSVLRSKFLRAKAKAPRRPIHHPIPKLMADARESYDTKVARQSKSLDEAVKEYQRRYKRAPPKGFDIWYEFAVENDAVMIDEYDNLVRDLEPFWQFNGKEIRQRCIDVGYLPSVDLVRISNGTTRTIDVSKGFDDSEVGARAKGFRVMLEKFQQHLPDMDFPINEKAEGRILVPWEEKLYSNLTADSSSELVLNLFQ